MLKYIHRIRQQYDVNGLLAILTLIVMGTQFVFVEGMAISPVKVIFMGFLCLLFLVKYNNLTTAVGWSSLFFFATLFICTTFHSTIRYSSLWYTALFLISFCVYYNLVYIRQAFTIDSFISFIKFFVFAYTAVLILQQLFLIGGIRSFDILNMYNGNYYAINRLNTLAIEPSHAARIMTVTFYAFLKCLQYRNGYAPSIRELLYENRYTTLSFLYTMVFIGSGTAFVGLAILSLYFLKKQYAIPVFIVCSIIYFVGSSIDYDPLNRSIDTLNAAMTGDKEEVVKVDNSASSRVNVIIDTFTKTDITQFETWVGGGTDVRRYFSINDGIQVYGLISYLIKFGLFLTCCFTSLFSLEVIMFFVIFGTHIGNIAYGWYALMIFSTIKYFKKDTCENI